MAMGLQKFLMLLPMFFRIALPAVRMGLVEMEDALAKKATSNILVSQLPSSAKAIALAMVLVLTMNVSVLETFKGPSVRCELK